MAEETKKKVYTCWHAHDYSTIEENGQSFLELSNGEDDADTAGIDARIEHVVKLLNENPMK